MSENTKTQVPAGYEKRSEDVVGYYNHDSNKPIHFIPRYAKTFDSGIDSTKPSVLIFGELIDECELKASGNDDDEESVMGQPGDIVGVWYKPGMRGLRSCAGAKVYMVAAGERDVGKGHPMKLFDVTAERGKGTVLTILEDVRARSARADLPFPIRGNGRQATPDTTDYSDSTIV